LGLVYVNGIVRGPVGEEKLSFLIDSGAAYTVIPSDVWRRIGLKPTREHEFILADGTIIRRKGIGMLYYPATRRRTYAGNIRRGG
jgi:predicted aspartyl protease